LLLRWGAKNGCPSCDKQREGKWENFFHAKHGDSPAKAIIEKNSPDSRFAAFRAGGLGLGRS
jgi:hypothetical protein